MGLDAVETVLWAEQEFGIEIPNADAAEIRKVGSFSSYVHLQLVMRDGFKAKTELQVFDTIKHFLVTRFAMKPDRITREAEFIKDLGMD
ncbi:MAG TPA: hypothetical protein VJ548_15120 [Azospira sp.]|nr:hypothetical protein [Azospira sp.]